MPRASLAAFAVLVSLSVSPAVAGGSTTPPAATTASSAVIKKVNAVRQRHGLRALHASGSLIRSSSAYARHLMAADYFGHARLIRTGGHFRRRGEALALQRGWRARAGACVRSWMRSPGHRALILAHGFNYIGVGRARGRFGRMRATIYVLRLGAR
jgi:uncharacterized protein YkwD